ncbi:hypothetical protein [Pseudomonas sp. B21-035]|uniref:hypothetical protein n=1 Tax=Pseudomonas sp. B21-035 TaxID=2895484 RepID=UPI00215FF184|nr:hypothetical protein [Pseudomonas sp. B21-035]UVL58691.1 hypothetical protein LOY22_12210 [Pseudomonas sp. B21-035]
MFDIRGLWFPLLVNPGIHKEKKYKLKIEARAPGGQFPLVTHYTSLSLVAAASSGVEYVDESRVKSILVGPHWSTLECDFVAPEGIDSWSLYLKTGLLSSVEIQKVTLYMEVEFGEGGGKPVSESKLAGTYTNATQGAVLVIDQSIDDVSGDFFGTLTYKEVIYKMRGRYAFEKNTGLNSAICWFASSPGHGCFGASMSCADKEFKVLMSNAVKYEYGRRRIDIFPGNWNRDS